MNLIEPETRYHGNILCTLKKKSRRFEEEIIDLQVFRGDSRGFEEENKNRGDSRSFEDPWEPCPQAILDKILWKNSRNYFPMEYSTAYFSKLLGGDCGALAIK